VKKAYLDTIALIERLHRECLEVIKADLDRQGIRDLNNVQAMILFNLGSDVLSVGELTNRGYYLGSNVSYNVKKMVENGYLVQERSEHDRRSIHVRLSEKGRKLRDELSNMHERHLVMLKETSLKPEDLQTAGVALKRLERFWTRASDLVQRRMAYTPAA
jgi:DNA-binding MarR family transcriptional regulator